MPSISREQGGVSSMLDLAESLHELGFNVHIGLSGSSSLMYRFLKNTKTTLPFHKIHTIPPRISKKLYKGEKIKSINQLKYNANSKNRCLLYEIFGRIISYLAICISSSFTKYNFYNTLKYTDIIFVTALFFKGAKESLMKYSNAKIYFNHAGSVKSFEDYILTEEHLPININPFLSNYVNFMSQFDKVLFQAPDQAIEFINQHSILEKKAIVIKPTCVENDVIRSKLLKNPYKSSTIIIANIGTLIPRKASHYSIEVFAEIIKYYPNCELHFVGRASDSIYKNSLDLLVEELGLKTKVFFHGHRDDYLRFMAHADIIIQTSKAEGVSRILRESMLLAKPIVSFGISGTSSILSNYQEAILIEPYNLSEFSKAILSILDNTELASFLGRNAQIKYFNEHSKAAYYVSWVKLLSENSI